MRYALAILLTLGVFVLIFTLGKVDKGFDVQNTHIEEIKKLMTIPPIETGEIREPEIETPYTDGEGQTHIIRTYPDEAETPLLRAQLHKTKLDAMKEVFPPASS